MGQTGKLKTPRYLPQSGGSGQAGFFVHDGPSPKKFWNSAQIPHHASVALCSSAILAYCACMSGRPKLLALTRRIEEFDLEDEIFESIAEGLSVQKVCEKFNISSRKMLYDWKKNNPRLEAKFVSAREISADAHAEKAGFYYDELDDRELVTSADVALATGKAKYRMWLASMRDRKTFGSKDTVTVNLTVGELHMEALQHPSARPVRDTDEIQEAEVISIEEGSGSDEDGVRNQTDEPSVPLLEPVPADLKALGALL